MKGLPDKYNKMLKHVNRNLALALIQARSTLIIRYTIRETSFSQVKINSYLKVRLYIDKNIPTIFTKHISDNMKVRTNN